MTKKQPTKKTSDLVPGDKVKVTGKGNKLFELVEPYQYRTTDGWYMLDAELRHRVFPTSMIKQ